MNSNIRYKDPLSVHVVIIIVISLLLLLPTLFFSLILADRQDNERYAVRSVISSWAEQQTLADPVIALEICKDTLYSSGKKDEDSYSRVQTETVYITAENSNSDIYMENTVRSRGRYEAAVYALTVIQNSEFDLKQAMSKVMSLSDFAGFTGNFAQIRFKVKDNRGIDEIRKITFGGQEYKAVPAADGEGFTVNIALDEMLSGTDAGLIKLYAEYTIRGSLKVNFIPSAGSSSMQLKGTNALPSFGGDFLPKQREINSEERKFSASYLQSSVSAGIPSVGSADPFDDESPVYTVSVQDQSSGYVLIERLLKYVLLFISVTFTVVLSFEIVTGRSVSTVQYAVIGIALIMFYLVLLSLSEHMSFALSYTAAALLMSTMISLYIKAVFESVKHGAVIFLLLCSVYAVLFAIVHIEAYAMLAGTGLLVLITGIGMFITRNLNDTIIRSLHTLSDREKTAETENKESYDNAYKDPENFSYSDMPSHGFEHYGTIEHLDSDEDEIYNSDTLISAAYCNKDLNKEEQGLIEELQTRPDLYYKDNITVTEQTDSDCQKQGRENHTDPVCDSENTAIKQNDLNESSSLNYSYTHNFNVSGAGAQTQKQQNTQGSQTQKSQPTPINNTQTAYGQIQTQNGIFNGCLIMSAIIIFAVISAGSLIFYMLFLA